MADVVFEDGELKLGRDSKAPLHPVGELRFVIRSGLDESRVRFFEDASGTKHMEVRSEGQRAFDYRRVEPLELTPSELEAYLGTYFSEELDATYRVLLGEDSRLVFEVSPLPEQILEPVFEDAFRWEDGTVVFERLPSGAVEGFRLQVGRARDFVFTRTDSE